MNRAEIVANIVTARDEAHAEAYAYWNPALKKHNYWRELAAATTYDETLTLFAQGAEYKIPGMANMADEIADYTRKHNDNPTEMTLAVAIGRRDALATVAYWMDTDE